MFAWARFKGDRAGWSWPQWRRALLIGALLLLCGNGGVTWAEKYIASGLAALLVATEPVWVVMFNWAITRNRPNAKVLFGVLIGLVGVGLLMGGGFATRPEVSGLGVAGAGVVLLASLAWAGGSVYANYRPIQTTTSLAAGMQMLSGGGLLMLLGLIAGDFGRLNLARASWVSLAAFAYLAIFGALGFTAYGYLLRHVSTARAATYAYVNPAVAVFLGWLVASEPLTVRMLVAAAVIVASVALITTYGGEHATSTDELHDSECPTHPTA